MVRTGSPTVDRLIDATNDHDVDAMMNCFHQDYRSEQPLHPEAGFGGRDQVGKNWSLMFAGSGPQGRCPSLGHRGRRGVDGASRPWAEDRRRHVRVSRDDGLGSTR